MHHLVLPPTGWGFMLIHDWQEHRARVLTDGGSSNVRRSKCSSSCYDITSATLDYFLKHTWKPRGKWAWIISHMDYDHYSITLRLIKTRQWHKPELVILPALYSSRACREALATIHMLASLLATALEIPRPLSSDLISIIRNVRRIGVGRGVKLRTGELAYHIIWPPPPGKVGSRCKTLLRRLTEKLEKAKRACVRRRGKKECEEAWSVGEREAGDIIEIMAPEDIYNENESIDLDKLLLTNGEPGTSWDTEDKEHYFQKGVERPVYDYRYIYYFASREFRDRELSRLYGSIINDFSIAYALERNQYPNNYLIPVEMKVKEFRPSTVLIEYSPVEIFLWSHIPLLYLSDLENALSPAIDYYKQYYLHHVKTSYIDVGIEIAAHHGNSYSPKLKDILPKILFLPRCYEHVPQHYTQNYRYRWRYINLPCVQRMYSMHNCGLEAEIYS